MLSGIGPEDHLRRIGIPLVSDLPVGDNLQDQVTFLLRAVVRSDDLVKPYPDLNIQQMYDLFKHFSGPLSRRVSLFLYTNSADNEDEEWPNLLFQITRPYRAITNVDSLVSQYCCHRNQWTQLFSEIINKSVIEIEMCLVKPKSFGTIRLQSSDPLIQPLIDPNLFADPNDLDNLVEIGRLGFYLVENTWLSNYIYFPKTPIPPCVYCDERPVFQCDQYIRCVIRQIGATYNHSVGGSRMGSVNRTDTVVDHRLRVKTIKRLRVCDSSVMPRVINAATYAPTIMVGEKCAQMIKHDNSNQSYD